MRPRTEHKILLIGWDGADWKIINPLMDRGLMPNLKRMVNQGVIGNLATLDPPYSPMLWTSIATGKRPYKHGVLGFMEPDPNGLDVRPVLSTSRKCAAIWNILERYDFKTHLVSWWPSHPAEAINGIATSNFFQRVAADDPDNQIAPSHSVYPQSMENHFISLRVHPDELTGAHVQPFLPNFQKLGRRHLKEVSEIIRILAENATTQNIITNILRTQTWNFAAVYFDGIDRLCHSFMKYHPPRRSHIPHDYFELFKDVVTGVYRFFDMTLGRLMALAGENAHIFLISDHGFHPDHLRPEKIPSAPAGIAFEHSPYGIFCAKGPGLKKDSLIYGASILDITPTLLHLIDLPVAEDMDGFPILGIHENPKIPATISSWEKSPGSFKPETPVIEKKENFSEQVLDQLADLGYIDKPSKNKAKAYTDAKRFCDLNLAVAYLDGGRLKEAIPLFEKLHTENPQAPWISFRLAVCYQMIGRHAVCSEIITQLKESHFYDTATIQVMEAGVLIGEGKYMEAVKLLKDLERKVSKTGGRVYLKIAWCYSMLGKPEEVENNIKKELEIDYENSEAHQFLGVSLYNQGRYEEALDSLLTAVGLDYNLAVAHYYIGRTFIAMGRYEKAATALELTLNMHPANNQARELLAHTYRAHLDAPEKAAKKLAEFGKYLLGKIIVVSGLPRSGTSMMMQMLRAGGVELFTDDQRKADQNNPRGYYEHDVVKKLTHNHQWLKTANGKAVKIVAPLLKHLPYNYQYKIIFMERDLYEVYASQQKMLHRLGKPNLRNVLSIGHINTFKEMIEKNKVWIDRHLSAEALYLPYAKILESPLEYARQIVEFIEEDVDPEAMIDAIDRNLYREKANRNRYSPK